MWRTAFGYVAYVESLVAGAELPAEDAKSHVAHSELLAASAELLAV
jgi:hypothetical protein